MKSKRLIPPEVRKIKIGGSGDERTSKAGNKWRVPEKWDHIGVTSTFKEDGRFPMDAEVMEAIKKERGADKPRAITVVLPSDDPADFFASFDAFYASRTLACYSDADGVAHRLEKIIGGDGKPVMVKVANKMQPARDWKEIPCDRKVCEFSSQCKTHTKVAFLLPYVNDLCGYSVFRTTSIKTKQNLEHALFHSLPSLTGGLLAHIPLDLCLYVTEFGAHRVRVLRLTWPGTRAELIDAVRDRVALDNRLPGVGEIGPVEISLRPQDETPEEQAEAQEEFHPGSELSELEEREAFGYADEGENLMETQSDILDSDEACTEVEK